MNPTTDPANAAELTHDDSRAAWRSPRPDSAELVDRVRGIFAELIELDKVAPGEVDRVVGAMVSHLQSWRPVSVAPLGVLPPPTERIRDPRM